MDPLMRNLAQNKRKQPVLHEELIIKISYRANVRIAFYRIW